MTSAEVLLRCPRRRLGRRISLWTPPAQWTARTISEAASSISATTSSMSVRTMRFSAAHLGRGGPDRLEVRSQAAERRRVDGGRGRRRSIMDGDLALHLGDADERPVPARLKLTGDQPIGRIGGVILTEGAVGGVARRLEITAENLADLIPLLRGLLRR